MGHKQGAKVTAASSPEAQHRQRLSFFSDNLPGSPFSQHEQTAIFFRCYNFRHGTILQQHSTLPERRTWILKGSVIYKQVSLYFASCYTCSLPSVCWESSLQLAASVVSLLQIEVVLFQHSNSYCFNFKLSFSPWIMFRNRKQKYVHLLPQMLFMSA